MRRFYQLALGAFLLISASASFAVTPDEMLSDPKLEMRARTIAAQLRCLVCQNQSIDDSDASLARDLRLLVREKLNEGLSDAQVLDYIHARYGDFVLLRPPVKLGTFLLWASPALALIGGGGAVWWSLRRRRTGLAATVTLTEEERRQLSALGANSWIQDRPPSTD